MGGYAGENCGERTQSERIMIRDGNMVLAEYGAGQSQVTSSLTRDSISKSSKALDQICPRQIARHSHAVSTSSRVMCKRIRPGNFPSSK